MMHVPLWGSVHLPSLSERTRFILRHGVRPWGMLVGALGTAILFVTSLWPMQRGARHGPLVLALLAFVCFAEWSCVAGWVIGAVLWTLKPRSDGRKQAGVNNARTGKDREP